MALPPPAPPSHYVWGRTSPHSLLPPPDCHPDRSGGICFTRRRGTIRRAPLRFHFLVSRFAFLVSDFYFLSTCHSLAQPARMRLPTPSFLDCSNEGLYLNQTSLTMSALSNSF